MSGGHCAAVLRFIGTEHNHAAAALTLGSIERKISARRGGFDRIASLNEMRTDRGADADRFAKTDIDRPRRNGVEDRVADMGERLLIAMLEDDDKLVTAPARAKILIAGHFEEAPCNFSNHRIAGGMAIAAIDVLEIVDVEQKQAGGNSVAVRRLSFWR